MAVRRKAIDRPAVTHALVAPEGAFADTVRLRQRGTGATAALHMETCPGGTWAVRLHAERWQATDGDTLRALADMVDAMLAEAGAARGDE